MRFKIENGQGAIYDPVSGDGPLTDPYDYLDLLKWHNEFEHVGIVEIRDYSVSLPVSVQDNPPRMHTWVLDTHDQAAEPFIYGYVTMPGGARRPFALHAVLDASIRTTATSGVPAHGFTRNVSLGIDGDDIVLHEWARREFWPGAEYNYPAMTIGVRVFITDLSITDLGSGTPATPNRSFYGDQDELQLGPFDANKRWLRISGSEAQFPLVNGVTFDGTYHRWRYRIPDASEFAATVFIPTGTVPAISDTEVTDVTA